MFSNGSPKTKKTQNNPYFLYLIFSLLALFSIFGLDYINSKTEKKSYIFPSSPEQKKTPPEKEALSHILVKNLLAQGISTESINQYEDEEGIYHILIDLPIKQFNQLSSLIEKELKKEGASISKKEEQLGKKKNYHLWHIKGQRKQKLAILYSCLKEIEQKEVPPQPEKPKKKVAIIIDDMGHSLQAIEEVCSIKKPLTVSILPFSPLAKETALIAHQNNLEIMLHLPMESINGQEENNEIEGIILSQMSEKDISRILEASFKQFPYISGVNNHMGSRITANEILMRIILEHIKEKNLFFVDSRTTSRSVAYKLAQTLGIPSAYRHVFLDGETSQDYIKAKMLELFRRAQKNGEAVGICHPTEETLKVLKENFHLVEEYNLEPVFASQIVSRKQKTKKLKSQN